MLIFGIIITASIDIKTIKLVSRMNESWDNYFILKITNGVKY